MQLKRLDRRVQRKSLVRTKVWTALQQLEARTSWRWQMPLLDADCDPGRVDHLVVEEEEKWNLSNEAMRQAEGKRIQADQLSHRTRAGYRSINPHLCRGEA